MDGWDGVCDDDGNCDDIDDIKDDDCDDDDTSVDCPIDRVNRPDCDA